MNIISAILTLILLSIRSIAQDTFSIVAIDTITGEIGSAGASCIDDSQISGGAIIISDILPGRGAIHTQAYWLPVNQANARLKMEEGLSPQEILLWLRHNDPQGPLGAQNRQYGIVDFDPQGHPRSAAFTGSGAQAYKGHRTGLNYAIQGNILLGVQILDSMEAHFLTATGTLADRLMYAMKGANVPGADTRCLNNGTSSLSAFLRVAKPGDADDSLYLDLNVPSLPAGQEPIDSLQNLYDHWKSTVAIHAPKTFSFQIFPNPASGRFSVSWDGGHAQIQLMTPGNKLVFQSNLQSGENHFEPALATGLYFVQIIAGEQATLTKKLFWIE